MSEFIKNHPSAIEVFIFHQKAKERSFGRIYRRLRYLIREYEISEKEFVILFDKVMNDNEESRRKEIRQLVVNNQANLRLCILSDAIDKKPIIDSFFSITKMIGIHDINELIESKDIDFLDFKFWFNRFSSGNRNLDQKTFSDLPLFLIRNIAENLDFRSQTKLREVSHGLRNIVDQLRLSIDELRCLFTWGSCIPPKNAAFVLIEQKAQNSERRPYSQPGYYNDGDCIERAFYIIKPFLSNPRLRLKNFIWDNELSTDINKELIDILNSLNQKLEIVSLGTSLNGDSLTDLLKAVKPGTLENIELRSNYGLIYVDRLAQLDQWKKAKSVRFAVKMSDFFHHIHHFLHFKRVDITVESASMDDILLSTKIIIDNTNLESFEIYTDNKPSDLEIKEALGLSDYHRDEKEERFIGRCDIPRSNDYLEVTITDYGIFFDRGNENSN